MTQVNITARFSHADAQVVRVLSAGYSTGRVFRGIRVYGGPRSFPPARAHRGSYDIAQAHLSSRSALVAEKMIEKSSAAVASTNSRGYIVSSSSRLGSRGTRPASLRPHHSSSSMTSPLSGEVHTSGWGPSPRRSSRIIQHDQPARQFAPTPNQHPRQDRAVRAGCHAAIISDHQGRSGRVVLATNPSVVITRLLAHAPEQRRHLSRVTHATPSRVGRGGRDHRSSLAATAHDVYPHGGDLLLTVTAAMRAGVKVDGRSIGTV